MARLLEIILSFYSHGTACCDWKYDADEETNRNQSAKNADAKSI